MPNYRTKPPLSYYRTALPGVDYSELQGKLIVIEGPDAVGRSTQVRRLKPWLEEYGHAVLDTGMARSALAGKGIKEAKEGGESRLLLKATGKLKHEGEEALKPGSTGYRILSDFVHRVNDARTATKQLATEDKNAPPFFDGVAVLDDRRLLRRVTLQLAARLPTAVELATVSKDGLKAMPALLDAVMKEDAFYDRLREGFNDIFLTLGADGNAETFLS